MGLEGLEKGDQVGLQGDAQKEGRGSVPLPGNSLLPPEVLSPQGLEWDLEDPLRLGKWPSSDQDLG